MTAKVQLFWSDQWCQENFKKCQLDDEEDVKTKEEMSYSEIFKVNVKMISKKGSIQIISDALWRGQGFRGQKIVT